MRKHVVIIALLGFVTLMSACKSNSKADTWSAEQKQVWTERCIEMIESDGANKAIAEDHCDCLLKKLTKKYTPEQAAVLGEQDIREILKACDYSW